MEISKCFYCRNTNICKNMLVYSWYVYNVQNTTTSDVHTSIWEDYRSSCFQRICDVSSGKKWSENNVNWCKCPKIQTNWKYLPQCLNVIWHSTFKQVMECITRSMLKKYASSSPRKGEGIRGRKRKGGFPSPPPSIFLSSSIPLPEREGD